MAVVSTIITVNYRVERLLNNPIGPIFHLLQSFFVVLSSLAALFALFPEYRKKAAFLNPTTFTIF